MAESSLKIAKSDLAGEEIEAAEVPELFMRNLHGALKSPMFAVPKPFETWMIDKVASSGMDIPVSQLQGFTQFTAQLSSLIATDQFTVSTSYVGLTTVGPELLLLPDGQYLFFYGADINIDTATLNPARMSIQVNAVAAADADACLTATQATTSVMTVRAKVLSNDGNNSVTAKYRSNVGTTQAHFANRWLIGLRYANA